MANLGSFSAPNSHAPDKPPYFDGTNYGNWKQCIQAYIETNNLSSKIDQMFQLERLSKLLNEQLMINQLLQPLLLLQPQLNTRRLREDNLITPNRNISFTALYLPLSLTKFLHVLQGKKSRINFNLCLKELIVCEK